jgi:SAM-dependent methyltransferase
MPIEWDAALFRAAYDNGDSSLGYDRRWLFDNAVDHADGLTRLLGLTAADKVVVVGCGFGWTVEVLASRGIEAVGTDISPYIQSAINTVEGTESAAVVLNEDSRNNGSRNRVRQAFAGANDPTHVISQHVLTSSTDAEIVDLLPRLEGFTAATISHVVTPLAEGDPEVRAQQLGDWPAWNWKEAADWRAFFDANGLAAHRLIAPGAWVEF